MSISFKESLNQSQAVMFSTRSRAAVAVSEEDYEEPVVWSECDINYRIYDEYIDSNVSYIDEYKNVHVHPSQVNLAQETNSQFIPFDLPRRYDGFDLSETTLWIHFVNASGNHGYDNPVNVRYSDDFIRFGWLVDDRATAVSGSLAFEIHATGRNSHGDKYEWISKPNRELTVLPSLCGDSSFESEFPPEFDVVVSDDGEGNVVLKVGVAGETLPDGEVMEF